MNEYTEYFKNQTLPKILMILAVTCTLVISGIAATKVLGSFSDAHDSDVKVESLKSPVVPDEIEVEEESDEEKEPPDESLKNTITPTAVPTPASLGNTSKTKNPTPTPTSVVTINSNTITVQTNSNACVITLWGKQYDITSLRSTHSGGDIFKCGTDMTTAYQGKHGTNVSRMQKYLVTGTTNSSNTTSQTNQNTSATNNTSKTGRYEDDEHEEKEYENDEEHKERYIDE